MGPLALTGITCFAATLAIGLLAVATPPLDENPDRAQIVRGMFFVQGAFAEGTAVLGVVVGILAIFLVGAGSRVGPAVAAGGAVGGAIVATAIILSRGSPTDRSTSSVALLFVWAIGSLGVVTGLMAVFTEATGGTAIADWVFIALGVVAGASALGIGVSGGRSIRAMVTADDEHLTEVRRALINRSARLNLVSIVALGAAMYLIVRT